MREFGILRAPFGGIESLCAVHQILILAGELRVARDIRTKLADLADNLVIERLGLGRRADFRDIAGVVVAAVSAWVADVAAIVDSAAIGNLAAKLAAALRTTAATLLVTRLLATTALLSRLLTLSLTLALLLATVLVAGPCWPAGRPHAPAHPAPAPAVADAGSQSD